MREEKMQECFKAAKYLKQLLEYDIKPKLGYLFFRQKRFFHEALQRYRDSSIIFERYSHRYYPRRFNKCGETTFAVN
jgi:hypothetical protein